MANPSWGKGTNLMFKICPEIFGVSLVLQTLQILKRFGSARCSFGSINLDQLSSNLQYSDLLSSTLWYKFRGGLDRY